MHASSRILLLLLGIAVLVVGVWVLFSINSGAVATGFSVAWAFVVLVATRVLLGIGTRYNSFRTRRSGAGPHRLGTAASALAELSDLLDRKLISDDEFASKRAAVMDRL